MDSTPLLLRIVLNGNYYSIASFKQTSFEFFKAQQNILYVTFSAPYTKLKSGNEFSVLESIRRAVAGLAGISLIRVTDIAVWKYKILKAILNSILQINYIYIK